MDWTAEKAEQAERALRRWHSITRDVLPSEPAPEILNFLCDDLNSAAALDYLGHVGQVLYQKAGNKWFVDDLTTVDENFAALRREFVASANLLGFLDQKAAPQASIPDLQPFAKTLSDLRKTAVATNDFTSSDLLKQVLVNAGLEVRMSKTGIELVPGPNFDPAKLDALK